jgi:peptidoglycan/LPS O-acetylase OafA/YrhL
MINKSFLNYRPEIDGLRALAVVAVVLYHAKFSIFEFNFFSGGFLGVDIFFVISGYLITSIIIKEININKKFCFINFYERRIRRIVPAFFFIIIFISPLAWLILLPFDYINYAKSNISGVFFYSNYFFWKDQLVYASNSALLKPLLHTWSLSIEEQFYILFPLIFIFCWKYLRKYLLIILILGLVISLIFSDFISYQFPTFNFYNLLSRGWELLAGVLVAFIQFKNYKILKEFYLPYISLCAFLIIIISLFYFDSSIRNPSLLTFIPVISTSILIYSLSHQSLVKSILSQNLFVKLGLISYSLYLWHFPLFAFARIANLFDRHWSIKIIIIFISIFLSLLTYHYIEKPFRDKNKVHRKKIIYFFIFFLIFISFISYFIIREKGFGNRLPKNIKENPFERPWFQLKDSNGKCMDRFEKYCEFNKDKKKTIYLVGDSHMGSLANTINEKIVKDKFNFKVIVNGGCFYTPNLDKVGSQDEFPDRQCNINFHEFVRQKLLTSKDSIVILGGNLPLYLSERSFSGKMSGRYKSYSDKKAEDLIENSLNELAQSNSKIIIIYPIPEFKVNVPQYLFLINNLKFIDFLYKSNLQYSYQEYSERNKSTYEFYDSILGKNVFRVYPEKIICNKTQCKSHNNDINFYSDHNHPSQYFINKIIEDIIKIQIFN